MNDNKVILGYPYNCAMYWMFSADNKGVDIYTTPQRGHSYYDILFGEKPSKYINELVSLSILYDEIIMAPADNPVNKYSQLNINSEWEWFHKVDRMEEEISFILEDEIINNYLNKFVDYYNKRQIIVYSLAEIYLASKFNASIIMSSSHKMVLERIRVILKEEKIKFTNDNNKILFYLDKNFQTSSLNFSINNLDEFIELKNNKNILEYGTAFRHFIKDVSNETEYYTKMYKIMEQPSLQKKVSGILTSLSFLLSFASLAPFGAPYPGIGSIAAGAGSLILDKFGNKIGVGSSKLLAPEISSTLSEVRIRKEIEHKLNESIKK